MTVNNDIIILTIEEKKKKTGQVLAVSHPDDSEGESGPEKESSSCSGIGRGLESSKLDLLCKFICTVVELFSS